MWGPRNRTVGKMKAHVHVVTAAVSWRTVERNAAVRSEARCSSQPAAMPITARHRLSTGHSRLHDAR